MTRLSMAAIEFLMPLTSDLNVHKETSSFLICSISDDGIIALVGHKNLKTANITVSKKMPEARLNMRITTSSSANNLSDEKMYAIEKIISYRSNSPNISVYTQNGLILSKTSNRCREFSFILTRVLDQFYLLSRLDITEPI